MGISGSILRDMSPCRNHGTLTNMDAAADWVVSGGKYALDFDGSDDAVSCGAAAAARFTGNLTISMWLHTRTTSSTVIMSHGDGSPDGWYFQQQSADTAKLKINNVNHTSGAGLFAADTWYHIAFRQSGSNGAFFSNGNLHTAFTSLGAPLPATGTLYFGQYTSGFNHNMMLDAVMLHSRALSESEIKTLSLRRGIAYETKRRASRQASAAIGHPASRRMGGVMFAKNQSLGINRW